MSAFIPPSWIEGTLYYVLWIIIPLIFALICGIIIFKDNFKIKNKKTKIAIVCMVICVFLTFASASFLADWAWHYQYEVPSVQEKIITVDNWQPDFRTNMNEVDSADDLLMQTTTGELYENNENFLFHKFNTREILSQMKPGGVYKIKFYGWREGYTSSAPNILSVEVIDESNATNHDISDYMTKRNVDMDIGK